MGVIPSGIWVWKSISDHAFQLLRVLFFSANNKKQLAAQIKTPMIYDEKYQQSGFLPWASFVSCPAKHSGFHHP